jgi:hypothetical protein
MKQAEEKLCKCESKESVVQLPSFDIRPHELESLDQYYCPQCNSFWREP